MSIQNTNVRLENLLSLSKAMYIMDTSGILLHHEYFLNQEEDPNLYAGLFTALNVFALSLNAGKIAAITLEDSKFILTEHEESGLFIVLNIHKNVNDDDGEWLLSQIKDRFSTMEKMLQEDHKGSFTLETLFDDRGKSIDFDTIKEIREDAIEKQNIAMDIVETLNLSKVNVNNRFWVKIRRIVTSLVENQKGLIGIIMMINKNDHRNILYVGREGKEKMGGLRQYIEGKFEGVIGIELETEFVQFDDQYCSVFNILIADGAVLGVSSRDKYLITNRINRQIERAVAALEKLASKTEI